MKYFNGKNFLQLHNTHGKLFTSYKARLPLLNKNKKRKEGHDFLSSLELVLPPTAASYASQASTCHPEKGGNFSYAK
jgi:hypothetical protein